MRIRLYVTGAASVIALLAVPLHLFLVSISTCGVLFKLIPSSTKLSILPLDVQIYSPLAA